MRADRANGKERNCDFLCNYIENSYGSCIISLGNTKVLCTCSVEQGVPDFKRGSGSGWLTAEYSMLPGSTVTRKKRDGLKKDGRGVEIQRLIGRALRQAVDLNKLGELTLTLDCDVLQADGGTRTASIIGAYVALVIAVDKLLKQGRIDENPVITQVAALSAGIVDNEILVDLCYQEDFNAGADINIVMNASGDLIEIQGTGEQTAFSLDSLNAVIMKTRVAILRIMYLQRMALKKAGVSNLPKMCMAVATNNKHKLLELNQMLNEKYNLFDLEFLGYREEIIENGNSFKENAMIKSEAVYETLEIPTIADDSGLCIEALQGDPGIYSARYGGYTLNSQQKNQLILKELEGVENRNAYFSCCISVSGMEPETKTFEGLCRGSILEKEHGTNGFGYDPIFCYADGRPLAEMSTAEKNQISHRGKAVKLLDNYLERQ